MPSGQVVAGGAEAEAKIGLGTKRHARWPVTVSQLVHGSAGEELFALSAGSSWWSMVAIMLRWPARTSLFCGRGANSSVWLIEKRQCFMPAARMLMNRLASTIGGKLNSGMGLAEFCRNSERVGRVMSNLTQTLLLLPVMLLLDGSGTKYSWTKADMSAIVVCGALMRSERWSMHCVTRDRAVGMTAAARTGAAG